MSTIVEAPMFEMVDANSVCWEVVIDDCDNDKLTHILHSGLYIFLQMRFHLKKSLHTFQRTMDFILSAVKYKFARVYLGDVIILLKMDNEHLHTIRSAIGLL